MTVVRREANRVSTKQLLTDVSARDVYVYWADEAAEFDDLSPNGSQVLPFASWCKNDLPLPHTCCELCGEATNDLAARPYLDCLY